MLEQAWLSELIAALQAGRPARTVPAPADAPDVVNVLQRLAAKPVLYVANVEEGTDSVPAEVEAYAEQVGARAIAVSARLDAELAELDPAEAASMRDELGIEGSSLQKVVRGAFDLLRLIAFFTADEGRPAQSWHIRRGSSAAQAAGLIHTDMQRGFVRAEVVPWQELVDAGGYAGARARGTLRVEGRDYAVADGDVVTVRFTP